MITLDNIKQLLLCLGYSNIEDRYIYHFDEFDCDIEVDFIKNKIIYPVDKGLIVNERQTCNLSDNENFVVLECVHRLLLKGYKPSHIEIEKRWALGHSQKSGRADICVMNETGNEVLAIIECKTYGQEFEKELNNLKSDGGQLFSYYQQEKSTKWLMLYATGFENNRIEHQTNTVSVFDTEEMLEKYTRNKAIKLYDDAHSKEKAFEVWKETYEQKIYDDLIFYDDTIAYNIGEKPLRKKDLKEFNPRDKIENKFEEILRHNNVSDKENAFNKLVALFICKLVDEITKQDNDIVDFQYKFGTDTYETLLDRLQRLYKEGMDKFMKEEIFYVSSEYPLNLFSNYKGQNRKNAIDDLKETFRKLKFYSNSDFAFKDVHNEELFKQNGKILVEVVKLFEKYKIVYLSKHQFLGDLFEQLLNQGFKQNEGQFFTPIPITRFIWESLPLETLSLKTRGDKYPKVIDYACGSGHFLTEGIDILNSVHKSDNNDWVQEKIFGIEKDYRLARVSKISLFMNGAGDGNIIFGDGLDNYKEKGIENRTFDILVANPPYSVKAFKSHLQNEDNKFELIDLISNEGSEIEVLFVERISQLIKPNGVAAVILPSTILSNTSNSYIGAREVILKNFKIKAITLLNSKTFGATETNTVVLFLEKYNEPPKYFKMMEDSIHTIFNLQTSKEWKDDEILIDYIEHIGVDFFTYSDFLKGNKDYDEWINDEYFSMYVDAFSKSTEFKNMNNKNSFKKLTDVEQKSTLNAMFYNDVKKVEKDKLFYFSLVRDSKTLVVKAPTTASQQYEFLGYQWSKRKGSRGIQIRNLGGKLYDPQNRESKKHISQLIRKAFTDELDSIVDKSLEEYVNIFKTKDMFDFGREEFDRAISLVERDKIKIDSKYKLEPLKKHMLIIRGVTYSKDKQILSKTDKVVLTADNISLTHKLDIKKEIYLNDEVELPNEKKLLKNDIFICMSSGSIKHIGKLSYITENMNKYAGGFMGILRLNSKQVLPKYMYFLLCTNLLQVQIKSLGLGGNIKNISSKIGDIKIPIPPINIQEEIIQECEKIENSFEESHMKIESIQIKIQEIFEMKKVIQNID